MNPNRVMVLALAVPLALLAGDGFAADAGTRVAQGGRTVIVAADQRALHAQEVENRSERLVAQVRAALPTSDITFQTDDTTLSVYVSDSAKDAQFLERARRYLSDHPDLVVQDESAKTFLISYSAAARKKFGPSDTAHALNFPGSLLRDLTALENFVRHLRAPLQGVQIEDQPDGAIVRSDAAGRGLEAMEAIGLRARGVYSIAPITDREWRVSLTPTSRAFLGPGQRLLMAAAAGEYLRSELRDPLGLNVQITDVRVAVEVIDPKQHRAFCDRLEKAISADADLQLTTEPSRLLRISLSADAPKGTAPEAGPSRALSSVFNDLSDIASPPTNVSIVDGSVAVRVNDPADNAGLMTVVRRALAHRPNLVIKTQPDQTLLIRFASNIPPVAPVDQKRLRLAVQARLNALRLQSVALSSISSDDIAVRFSTAADAATFRRALNSDFGLAIKMVDEAAPETSRPPRPGDERLPQRGGGYLWVRPVSVITGDMIAFADSGVDLNNQPDVNFRLTEDGRIAFADATAANVGKRFAIVLDGVIISAPVIESPIMGGSGQITGNFTAEHARLLAESIMAQRDDLPLKSVEVRHGS